MVDLTVPGARRLLADRLGQAVDAQTARPGKYDWRIKPSKLGSDCVAQLWYAFRWVAKQDVPGQRARIFRKGNAAEAQLFDDLRSVGFEVLDKDPSKIGSRFEQWNYKALDGHISAYLDGVGRHPEFTGGMWALLECKTMNKDHFNKLVAKQSVMVTEWEYYVQHVIYLEAFKLPFGIMFVECKNTSEYYFEYIMPNPELAQRSLAVAHTVRDSKVRPARVAESPTFFKCKGCTFQGICHLGEKPDRNCRSCVNCYAIEGGKFACARFGPIPGEKEILEGCGQYEAIQ